VPVQVNAEHSEQLKHLETWIRSYKPDELFDLHGRLKP
jgi:xylulose-5-phosphate/fructose-6-phosphate phosphoketolase